ncbi:MFS transporter [Paenibacillus sp. N4]|uniref:MFS transporter n=1 Tax=Paenibacillus vietnamensis TaxID=2590547 RepID=UPI001CD145D1|nr:MFS transporter [Paenibacillus vietnamensis]MCA0757400.1 MFS transporter [Paenibacillus vietnamensis]
MRLSTVIAIAFSFQLMMNITRPLVTLYAISLGANAVGIGAITAAYALFPLLFAIPIGKAADAIGDRAPVRIGVAGMMAGTALPFLFPEIWSLYASQALIGVSHIFISISLQNLIGNMSNSQNRDHHFGLFSMAVALSGIAGPILGGLLADFGSYGFAFGIAAVTGLVPMAFSVLLPHLRRERKQEEDAGTKGSALELLRIPPLRKALASSALVLYSRDVYVAYFPLFASEWGMSASTIGWIIGVQGLTMVLVRLFLARLTERFGREPILWASIVLAGVAFLLVPLTQNTLLCGLLSALMGAGLGCGQPLSMTTTYNASPKHRTGEVLGLRMASNRLSQMLAPLFFGMVGAWSGIIAIFYVSGAFLIGGAFLTTSSARKRQAASVNDT